ncbi:MAG: guanylate kinase [Anaerolineae bacterium UTCFX2]|nr:guanylate kinase [Anaerolineae bacterium]MCZ7552119.1 guanylate kinase [Anaerolineales bacterium]OQY92995.1 MAG: guanylate kinase [Anaerolineae bacterium UTCFX2]
MSSDQDFYPHTHEPLLIVISGPSGSGKDTVIEQMEAQGLPFEFVVTATTRPPRADEVYGVDYLFLTKDQFAEMIEKGELLEYAIVYEDFKGVPQEQVRLALNSGKDVVMRLDVQGAKTMRRLAPEALLIFLTAQDEDELVRRLTARKSEDTEGLKLRIATARQELKQIDLFDYVVINRENHLDETLDTIMAIIKAEHARVHHRKVAL